MFNIRRKVFETNSSAVHNMTLLTEEEYNKWKSGLYYIDMYNDTVLSEDEVEIIISEYANKWGCNIDDEEEVQDILNDNNIYSELSFDLLTEEFEAFANRYDKDGQIFYAVGYTGYAG